MSDHTGPEGEVLILAPFGKDSALIAKILQQSGIQNRLVANGSDLVSAIPEHAGVAIVAEEALLPPAIAEIAGKLAAQPPWSDFPMIVLTGGGTTTAETEFAVRARAPLGNVVLLERPLRPATLVSAVRTALAARQRQYEIRDHLEQRKLAEEALRGARDALESIVEERTTALRRLSAQLLRVQDDERRRIARELHDSLGQYLAAAKINLDTLALAGGDSDGFRDALQLIDQAIAETRTLSHLLHPPLLDAAGLASALTWYVEGFAKRSGIQAKLTMPENVGRLGVTVETALFRIMQEALTNVHRHSGSRRVEISLSADDKLATLVIRDFGKGIPKDVVSRFQEAGTNVGVGLAGIRERLKELGGTFQIRSTAKGTTLTAAVPISDQARSAFASAPTSQIYSSLAT